MSTDWEPGEDSVSCRNAGRGLSRGSNIIQVRGSYDAMETVRNWLKRTSVNTTPVSYELGGRVF
jgi:hypothetical protein